MTAAPRRGLSIEDKPPKRTTDLIAPARSARALAAAAAACGLLGLAVSPAHADAPFYMGADVSLLPFIESRGGVFRDNGEAKPAERILVDHGANLFRLRLFVNPDPTYANTAGAIQDRDYAIALAQRLKPTGARLLLDFHYSDTWADPGHQTKPAAWSTQSFTQLRTTLHDYTRDTLSAFRDAGVMPEMVQVGNEVTVGMLWNDGKIISNSTTANNQASWQRFGQLTNSAIQGVRDAELPGERVRIAVHIDRGNQDGLPRWYFDNLHNPTWGNVSDYDVMGVSLYPSGTDTLANLQANLNDMVSRYSKNIMVLETNYPWKGTGGSTAWPVSATGQQQFLGQLRDLVRDLPNGRGEGVVWWYPEAIQVPGTFIWQGGAIALFDTNGNALPAVNALAGHWPPRWNSIGSGIYAAAANWSGGIPNAAGASANFLGVATAGANVQVNTPVMLGNLTFNNPGSYQITGPAAITLDALSGSATIDVLAGDHVIAASLKLADATTVTVTAAANTLTVSNLQPSNVPLTKAGAGRLLVNNIRVRNLAVNAGTLQVASTGGSGDGTSKVPTLSVAPGARLDLTDNKLITDTPAGTFTDGAYTGVQAEVARAYNFGAWDMPGLMTSMPDAGPLVGTTTIGVASAEQILFIAPGETGTFAGQTVTGASTIAMYTYAGDLNFDGLVDAADYGVIDNWIQFPGTAGYANGDFNFDGVIDASDYGIIDNTIQLQGAPFPTGENLSVVIAVPEPTLVGLALLAGSLLHRRRPSSPPS
jgi:arabinogalactan endo-1,4-beta-galactosidase